MPIGLEPMKVPGGGRLEMELLPGAEGQEPSGARRRALMEPVPMEAPEHWVQGGLEMQPQPQLPGGEGQALPGARRRRAPGQLMLRGAAVADSSHAELDDDRARRRNLGKTSAASFPPSRQAAGRLAACFGAWHELGMRQQLGPQVVPGGASPRPPCC